MAKAITAVALLLLGVFAFWLGTVLRPQPEFPTGPPSGQRIGRAVVFDRQGTAFIVDDLVRSETPTTLIAFSLGCQSCVAEIDVWVSLSRLSGNQFVGLLNVSDRETLQEVERLVHGAFPLFLMDAQGRSALGIRQYPTIVQLDPNGTVRKVWIGESATDSLRSSETERDLGQ
jgi:hypothetical protein